MCDIQYGDYEHARAWAEVRIKRARKDHACAACGTTIRAGTSYWRRHWVMSGTAGDEACCDACWKIAEEFGEAHRMTPCPSNLLETLDGCASEGDEDSRRWVKAAAQMRSRGTRARNKRAAEGVPRA